MTPDEWLAIENAPYEGDEAPVRFTSDGRWEWVNPERVPTGSDAVIGIGVGVSESGERVTVRIAADGTWTAFPA